MSASTPRFGRLVRALGAIVTLSLGVVSCAPAPRTATTAPTAQGAVSSMQGKSLTKVVGNVSFAYESYGEGLPVFFLHGMPTDRRSMVPRLEPFFAGDKGVYQRIYVDLPGAGGTPGSDSIVGLDGYVDALGAFFDAMSNGKRFALVGTSFGGYLTLAYASKHPERLAGLALIVPSAGNDAPRPPRQTLVNEPGVLDGEPPPFAAAFDRVATVHTRAVRDAIKHDVLPGSKSVDEAFMARINSKPLANAATVRQIEFAGPALVIAGRQDAICGYVSAREIAERFPRATYAVLDRAAHALMAEQNELLRAHVLEWLARVREGLGQPYELPR